MYKEKFIQHLRNEKNYSSHTEISYFRDIAQFEEFIEKETGEKCDPTTVDRDQIRIWISTLMSEGIKSRSVNRKLSAIRSFFKYLQKINVIEKNPALEVTGPKVDKEIPSFVSHKDLTRILDDDSCFSDDFEGQRDRFLIELLYVTGMRRAEITKLKDIDIDKSSKTIRVLGKRNKERLIPLSDRTLEKVNDYLTIRNEKVENKSPFLFVKKDGNPIYPNMIYNIVNRYLEGIQTLAKKSPHILRHSFATEMLNNGAEITAVKEILGHSSLSSTEVYTHVTFEELKKAYQHAHPRADKL